MRQAHTYISDSEFEDLQQEAVESGVPLTRSKLQKNSQGYIILSLAKKMKGLEKTRQAFGTYRH